MIGWLVPPAAYWRREMRKYVRNHKLLAYALVLPLFQLVIIGYAIGGRIQNTPVALVDLDGGPAANEIRQRILAVEAGARTFITHESELQRALDGVADGSYSASITIPPGYSRQAASGGSPALEIAVDNADPIASAAVAERLRLLQAGNTYAEGIRLAEVLPPIDYVQYFCPAAITLAIYVACMIGGGVLYIDDRQSGVHESYLATPVSSAQLTAGILGAGVTKAVASGIAVTFAGSAIAGLLGRVDSWRTLLLLGLTTVIVSWGLCAIVNALLIRVRDPMVARAALAVLNIVLLFPSGAIYPVSSFPGWLRALSSIDPVTYSVHAYRALLLRGTGYTAISADLAVLCLMGLGGTIAVWVLFPRRLEGK